MNTYFAMGSLTKCVIFLILCIIHGHGERLSFNSSSIFNYLEEILESSPREVFLILANVDDQSLEAYLPVMTQDKSILVFDLKFLNRYL